MKSGLVVGDATITTASAADLDYETTSSSQVYMKHVIALTDIASNVDVHAARSFQPSGSGALDTTNIGTGWLPQFTKVSGANIQFIVPQGGGATHSFISHITYSVEPTIAARGDFEATSDSDISIPDINLSLRSDTIAAKTRMLKAVWSPAIAKVLNA